MTSHRQGVLAALGAAVLATVLAWVAAPPAAAQAPGAPGVVFVLDDSGSMAGSDQDLLRATGTGIGLRELGAGPMAAAVTFDTEARVAFAPTPLDGTNAQALGEQVRASLRSSGGTDFEPALQEALRQLQAMPVTGPKAAVLFSDGAPNEPFSSHAAFAAAGIPIHTIRLGGSDRGVMQGIAQGTGGTFSAVDDPSQIQGAIARAIAAITGRPANPPLEVEVPPGGTRHVPFDVAEGTQSLSALASWGAGQFTVRLVRPDGTIMWPGGLRPGETFEEQPTFARATAQGPAAGEWKVRLTAHDTNPRTARIAIDLIGGGASLEHPLNSRPDPAAPGCETEVSVHGRVAWSPCFRPITGGWQTTHRMRIAGLDFQPLRGKSVKIMRDGRLVTDNAELSVQSSGPLLPDGKLVLRRGPLQLSLRGGQLLPLSGSRELERLRIGGLPVVGNAGVELGWTSSGASAKLALSLGRDFASLLPPGGVDGGPGSGSQTLRRGFGLEVTLNTSNERGLSVESVSGRVETGRIFRSLAVESLTLTYRPEHNLWTGGATVVPFGGALARYGLPKVSAEIGLTVNPVGFGSVKITVSDINKPIGPYVFLQKLGGSVTKVPPPFTVAGEIGLSAGPKVKVPVLGEMTAVELDGTASYSYPATFKGSAGVKLLRQSVADASFEINAAEATGSFSGNVALALHGNGLNGRLEGWLQRSRFQLYGNVALTVFHKTVSGAEGFVSSRGMGACRRGWGPDFGFVVDFGEDLPAAMNAMTHGCDFGGLVFPAQPAQVAGGRAFTVPRGTSGMLVRVRGAGGQPAVVVRGGGREFPIGAGQGYLEFPRQLIAIRDESSNDIWLVLNAPAPGTWTVDPLPGSAPLEPLGHARALPQPRLRASVRRARGGRRVVRWRARRVPGQVLRFVERGPGPVSRVLRVTRRPRGAFSFRPASGPGGVRRVEVTVEHNGTPRVVRTAGRFRTGAVRPRRPSRVTVRRQRGGVVRIGWRGRRAGIAGWRVTGRLRDGRRLDETLSRRRSSLRLYGVDRRTSGRFSVRAVGRSGIQSRARSRTLRRARRGR